MASAGGLAFVLIVVLLLAGSFTNLAPGALLEWGRTVAIRLAARRAGVRWRSPWR